MSTWTDLLMEYMMGYLRFISRKQTWKVLQGLDGSFILAECNHSPSVFDLSPAQEPFLWLCGQDTQQQTIIQLVRLSDFAIKNIGWYGNRVTAVASSPNGQQAVVLESPITVSELPRLWLWQGYSWQRIESSIVPDISTKLAWLDSARIVYESYQRRLLLLDFNTGNTEIGPLGCCPTVAGDLHEWYAVIDGRVFRFPFESPFAQAPARVEGFNFGCVTSLRVTRDGRVFTWTEPRFLYQSKGYFQEYRSAKNRISELDDGIGAVLGPYEFKDKP